MINTVIFDMDGTVLDTLADLAGAINHELSRYHMPQRTENEVRSFVGNGIRVALKLAATEGTTDEVLDDMVADFRTYYDAHCLDNTKPYEGITELMKSLSEKGCKLGIVSNKIDPAVKELSDRFFKEYVTVAIGEKPGINRKPAPDTVTHAMKELGSSKEETVYVGDSEVDVLTAKNTGIPCISVLWGFRDKDFLKENGATTFADAPSEILDLIK